MEKGNIDPKVDRPDHDLEARINLKAIYTINNLHQTIGDRFITRERACSLTKLDEARMWLEEDNRKRPLTGCQKVYGPMNMNEALRELYVNNQKIALPEWCGCWYLGDDYLIHCLTKDNEDVITPDFEKYANRTDWQIYNKSNLMNLERYIREKKGVGIHPSKQ